MFKRLVRSPRLIAAAGTIAAWYIELVYKTSRILRSPDDLDERLRAEDPQIFATWHGQFLLAPKMRPSWCREVVAMVARHGDAEFIAETLKHFGTRFARGAGAGSRKRDRGGAQALRESLRALKRGATIVITADVPPGPARHASLGIVTLARLSGRPIVPFAMATKRFIAFRTWSALTLNLPFSTIGIAVGDPVRVAPDASDDAMEEARLRFERGLNATMAKAYALAGSDDPLSEAYRERKSRPGLLLGLYRLATWLGRPLAPLILSWRTRAGKEEALHRPERYGIASGPRPDGFVCWLHTASVGETNAALPLIESLAASHPDMAILLTTGTVTSARLARERLPERAIHQYLPLDNQDLMGRFLDHWRPGVAVLIESEIWPNLVLETRRRRIPMVLINARMSPRSFRRWKRLWGLSHPLFSALDLVLAQNPALARSFIRLGARRALSVGNLKVDSPPPPVDQPGLEALRAALRGRTVFLAASTHPGENEIVTAAHVKMRDAIPDLLTIIVPRHPSRGPSAAKAVQAAGLTPTLRSQDGLPDARTDIYIADTIGELGMFYALAPVAFIGGSLIRRGGQNPLEAIKLGAAVLTGPSWQNFKDCYSELIAHGGCKQIEDAETMAVESLALLRNGDQRRAMMAQAELCIAEMGGALARTLAEIETFLPRRDEGQHGA
jgi:3-deoxy-D-manno-octulosonic-acid transferase